jgi:ribosomal protein L7/L12
MSPIDNIALAGLLGLSLLGIVVLWATRAANRKVESLRLQGIYPPAGQESDADVVRLLGGGRKIMAIRCYRSVHNGGLKVAKDAVEQLARRNA